VGDILEHAFERAGQEQHYRRAENYLPMKSCALGFLPGIEEEEEDEADNDLKYLVHSIQVMWSLVPDPE